MIHSKENNRRIERSGRATYNSKRWKMLRRAKLAQTSICERCHDELATEVHHKEGVEAQPYPTLDGLEALCRPCHSKITRADQLGLGKAA